jgi:hypothetical protein
MLRLPQSWSEARPWLAPDACRPVCAGHTRPDRRTGFPKRLLTPELTPDEIFHAAFAALGKKAKNRRLGIPVKLNAHFERKPNGIPGRSRTPSERSDAGMSIDGKVLGFVKR